MRELPSELQARLDAGTTTLAQSVTAIGPSSADVARDAAGSLVALCREVVEGRLGAVFRLPEGAPLVAVAPSKRASRTVTVPGAANEAMPPWPVAVAVHVPRRMLTLVVR